jgi:RNA polymerase-binding transcription factor DksA
MAQKKNGRLEQFREILRSLRREKEASSRRLLAQIARCGEGRPHAGDSYDDAQEVESVGTMALLVEADRATLHDIALALGRIRTGSYGICAGCSECIPYARLTANPLAIRCYDCQQEVEFEEQRTRRHPVYPEPTGSWGVTP